MKWTIVAFRHPEKKKSLLYKQNVSSEDLGKVIDDAMFRGANLMSIRGFDE